MMRLAYIVFFGVFGGCAVTTKDARDLLEEWNRGIESFNDSLDTCMMKPIARLSVDYTILCGSGCDKFF